MEREEFEKLVAEAINALPEKIRGKMDNVSIVIEDLPSRDQLSRGGTRRGDVLLGLYEGIPKTRRGLGYTWVLPDKITIFQNPIENLAGGTEAIKEMIRQTVWHEVAHHFGFDEEGVAGLAGRRRAKIRKEKI